MGSSSRPPQASCHVDLTAGCTSTTAGAPVTRPLVDNRAKRFYQCGYSSSDCGLCHTFRSLGQIAQLVEQRTENPCVGSSSLPLSIKKQGWWVSQVRLELTVKTAFCLRLKRRSSNDIGSLLFLSVRYRNVGLIQLSTNSFFKSI